MVRLPRGEACSGGYISSDGYGSFAQGRSESSIHSSGASFAQGLTYGEYSKIETDGVGAFASRLMP